MTLPVKRQQASPKKYAATRSSNSGGNSRARGSYYYYYTQSGKKSAKTRKVSKAPKTPQQMAYDYAAKKAQQKVEQHKQRKTAQSKSIQREKISTKTKAYALHRPHVQTLGGEYVFAMFLVILGLLVPAGTDSYSARMRRFMVQVTGVSAVYFLLSLGASSVKTGKIMIAFGGLIDVSMMLYLFSNGSFASILQPNSGSGYAAEGPASYTQQQAIPLGQANTGPQWQIGNGITFSGAGANA